MKKLLHSLNSRIRFCLACTARFFGLHLIPEKHRHRIHFAVIGIIVWDLIHAGMKLADAGFVFLSALMEMEGATDDERKPPIEHPSAITDAFALLTIPDADHYRGLLDRWANAQGITRYQWDQYLDHRRALGDANVRPSINGSSWQDEKTDRRFYVIRPTLTPSQSLAVTLHELSHLVGTARAQADRGLSKRPCWITELALMLTSVDMAVRAAVEQEAETTVHLVFTAMRWDDTYSTEYLKNYGASMPIADLRCIQPTIKANADRFVAILHGGNHAS